MDAAHLNDTLCTNINDVLSEFYNDWTTKLGVRILVVFLYTFNFIAGCTGNLCVIVSVARNKNLQSVRNLFIVSLSCSDLVVCLISGTITPTSGIVKNWYFGSALCHAVPLCQAMSICISAFTLTCIAIDRYILIIHPTSNPIQRNHAIAMISAIWILASALGAPLSMYQKSGPIDPFIMGPSNRTIQFCGVFCSENWGQGNQNYKKIYGTLILMFQFLIPLIIITFCYARICIRLGQGMQFRKNSKQPRGVMTDRQRIAEKRKHRTNRMLIGMVCFFAFCWLPQVTLNLLRDFSLLPNFISVQENFFQILCNFIAMTTTFWNPFLYAYLNDQFRTAFVQLIPCLKLYFKVQQNNSNTGTTGALGSNQARIRRPSPSVSRDLLATPSSQRKGLVISGKSNENKRIDDQYSGEDDVLL